MWSGPVRVRDHWTSPIRAVFDAFLSHANEDLDAGHSSLFADALGFSGDALRPVAAESILIGLHEYKHYFRQYEFGDLASLLPARHPDAAIKTPVGRFRRRALGHEN